MDRNLGGESILKVLKHFSDAVWEYDRKKNQIYMYHDRMTPELCGQWISYDRITQWYREQYLDENDREVWDRFLSPEQLTAFAESGQEAVKFHLRFAGEGIVFEWHEIFVEKMENGSLLISSRDIHDSICNGAITKAVENEFDYVVHIDLIGGGYVLYTSTKELEDRLLPPLRSHSYMETLHDYNRQFVVPEEVEELTACMEIDHVCRQLQTQPEYILYATVQDGGERRYKKLRFCYLDKEKTTLLLARVDITDITREQELRRAEEKAKDAYRDKLTHYLDSMPVAFCNTKVLLDETNQPYDFVFTYSNRLHSELEGAAYGELIGKGFYEFFANADKKWLKYYYETAFLGIPHTISSYSPEIGKHLLIQTFQTEPGYCGCVLRDITVEWQMEKELEMNQERTKQLLRSTTDAIFQYDTDCGRLLLIEDDAQGQEKERILCHWKTQGPKALEFTELGFVEDKCRERFQKTLERVIGGEREASCKVMARLGEEEQYRWFQLTFFELPEGHTGKRQILGYMSNIDLLMKEREHLRKEARQDALTGILNAGAGKKLIEKRLTNTMDGEYQAMFIMDLDDFKGINDSMGHMAGDEALKLFADHLRRTFRESDIYYRLGGDEFVAFVSGLHEPRKQLEQIMQRALRGQQTLKTGERQIRFSAGIYATDQSLEFRDFYVKADMALYQAKREGKNGYRIVVE